MFVCFVGLVTFPEYALRARDFSVALRLENIVADVISEVFAFLAVLLRFS